MSGSLNLLIALFFVFFLSPSCPCGGRISKGGNVGGGGGRQREARALQTKPGVTKKKNRMFGRRYSAAFIAIQPLAEYLKNEPSRTALKYNHKEGTFQIFFIFFWGGPGKQRGWSTPQHNKIYYWDPYISVVYMEFVAALSSDHLHVFSILFYFFYFIFFYFFYFCFFLPGTQRGWSTPPHTDR